MCENIFSQQTVLFNQYTLNSYGLNPAYAGSNNKWEFMGGQHRQWIGLPNAPTTTFISAIYTYRRNFSYSGSHGFGVYIDQDVRGMLTSRSYYASYSYHIHLNAKYNLSFGAFIGARGMFLSQAAYSGSDPAFSQSIKTVYLYPDIIPGFRLYSKKMFVDMAIRQLYKNKVDQGSQQLGTNSKLIPHVYITIGQKVTLPNKDFMFMPTLYLQSSIKTFPMVNVGALMYYRGRIGIGFNHTFKNSFTSILHVRFNKESIFGISYCYPTNNAKYISTNTVEVIFGFTPKSISDGDAGRRDVVRCPAFDF